MSFQSACILTENELSNAPNAAEKAFAAHPITWRRENDSLFLSNAPCQCNTRYHISSKYNCYHLLAHSAVSFDWHVITLEAMRNAGQNADAFAFVQKAYIALAGMDALANLFLFAALARLIIVGLYWRWYRKAINTLSK